MEQLTPKTIATVMDAEQAKDVLEHIQGALDEGANTVLLYTTLKPMVDDPQQMSDFPVPDLHVFQTVFVLGLGIDTQDYQAQVSEQANYIEGEGGEA